MNTARNRTWMVRWLYLTAAAHLLVGVLLPWLADAPVFDAYHRSIEAAFWGASAPAAARAQQVWWIALFGPTVQSVAIWMAVLIRIGDRQRSPAIWGWLIVGLLVWAPQDVLISLRADCWPHLWVDGLALLTMLPPLFWLYRFDRRPATTTTGLQAIPLGAES